MRESYSAVDFVLDPVFQQWIIHPDAENCAYWERFLIENPEKEEQVEEAKLLLRNLSREIPVVKDDLIESTWSAIESRIDQEFAPVTHPTSFFASRLKDRPVYANPKSWQHRQSVSTLLILLFVFACAGLIVQSGFQDRPKVLHEKSILYEEKRAPRGVKSTIKLADGSRITINSESRIRYAEGFGVSHRELFLDGEAYFDVAKDSLRPFIVHTNNVSTKALGTTFNIKAYPGERQMISLLSGSVMVRAQNQQDSIFLLKPNKGLIVEPNVENVKEVDIVPLFVLAWTQKTIHFDKTPIDDVILTLERWYGVEFKINRTPPKNLKLSGVFRDQSIEGVLKGLSYSARFEYVIDKKTVELNFH